MDPLTPALALEIWEAVRGRHAVDRAIALLAAATPGEPVEVRDAIAALPVGHRDRGLLRLRQSTFGDGIAAAARCPACGAAAEIELSCAALLAAGPDEGPPSTVRVDAGGQEVVCRLPDSYDLAAIAGLERVEEARWVLLSRCLVSIDGGPGDPSALSSETLAALSEAAAVADPCADFELDLRCPACERVWESTIEPASVLWEEVAALARRSLFEVDRLARAYGWTEREILALTPARRALYLDLTTEGAPA